MFSQSTLPKSKNCTPQTHNGEHRKWLPYYLDFCNKYPVPSSKTERIPLFCDKLKKERQTVAQRERAAYAVSLYYEMLNCRTTRSSEEIPVNEDIKDKFFPTQTDRLPEDGSYYISEDAPTYPTYYDIRVIQKLLVHASLKTTMIYTHGVPVRAVKEPISPLDLDH